MTNWIEAKEYSSEEVMKVLPHRYPFLLVDRVLEIKTGKPLKMGMDDKSLEDAKLGTTVKALKNVTFNEPQFQGHFPEYPIFPGVLTLEFMAQSAAFCLVPFIAAANNGEFKRFNVALAGFDSVRFRKPVGPGDQMISSVEMINFRKNIYSFKGEVSVNGKVVAEGNFMAQVY